MARKKTTTKGSKGTKGSKQTEKKLRYLPIRMKHVVDSGEVYHLFANQRDQGDGSADYARNGSGNVSFSGRRAYSYRAVIGYLYPEKGIALLSSRHWSATTSRHQSDLQRAFSRNDKWETYKVPHCEPLNRGEHLANLAYLRSYVRDQCNTTSGYRQSGSDVLRYLQRWAAYALAFGLTSSFCRAERMAYKLIRNASAEDARMKVNLSGADSRERDLIRRTIEEVPSPAISEVMVLLGVADDETRQNVDAGVEGRDVAVYRRLQDRWIPASVSEITQKINNDKHQRQYRRDAEPRHAEWIALTAEAKDELWRMGDPDGLHRDYGRPSSYAVAERGYHWYRPESIEDAAARLGTHAQDYTLVQSRQVDLLRVNDSTGDVYTSGCVTIPRKEALRVWRAAYRLWLVRTSPIAAYSVRQQILDDAKNRTISRAYHLGKIDDDGLFIVGCHRIHFDEMSLCALRLGAITSPIYWIMPGLPAPTMSLPSGAEIDASLEMSSRIVDSARDVVPVG